MKKKRRRETIIYGPKLISVKGALGCFFCNFQRSTKIDRPIPSFVSDYDLGRAHFSAIYLLYTKNIDVLIILRVARAAIRHGKQSRHRAAAGPKKGRSLYIEEGGIPCLRTPPF